MSDDVRSTTRTLGAALGLFATFIAALGFAFILSRLVGGVYVTFAMPLFAGMLIAALASMGPRRFGFGERRPLVMMMVLGAVVAWLGQHLLAYLRVVELVAQQKGVDAAGGLAALEQATGASGLWAYLEFVGGDGAWLSPIGFLGRLELGAIGTLAVAIVELALLALTASWSILYRTREVRRAPPGPVALLDEAAAADAAIALGERRFDALALIAQSSRGPATHALCIDEGEVTAEAYVATLDRDGRPAARSAFRLMPIDAARTLRRALAATAAPASLTAARGDHDGAHDP